MRLGVVCSPGDTDILLSILVPNDNDCTEKVNSRPKSVYGSPDSSKSSKPKQAEGANEN